jgi:hypothetical protein
MHQKVVIISRLNQESHLAQKAIQSKHIRCDYGAASSIKIPFDHKHSSCELEPNVDALDACVPVCQKSVLDVKI